MDRFYAELPWDKSEGFLKTLAERYKPEAFKRFWNRRKEEGMALEPRKWDGVQCPVKDKDHDRAEFWAKVEKSKTEWEAQHLAKAGQLDKKEGGDMQGTIQEGKE